MADYLEGLTVQQVAGWYRRLANLIGAKKVKDVDGTDRVPLSALLLGHYLDNRDPKSTFSFDPPLYLRQMSQVQAVLAYHRSVFLSEKKTPSGGIGGIAPRLRGDAPYKKWQPPEPLFLYLESLVQTASGIMDIVRIEATGSAQERDIFTSLDGFQLRSEVWAAGAGYPDPHHLNVTFSGWYAMCRDRYDWDFSKHLTLPNPDYQSKAADAVRTTDQTLTVYHKNAQRLEVAKLAAPFDVASNKWSVTDKSVTGPASVAF